MAAHRDPHLFDTIVVYEPIVFDPDADRPAGSPQSPHVVGARRRRPSFDSFEAAIDNYRSKLPMNTFDPEVVRLYVAHGFRSAPEGVRLKCDPEYEARTFESGGLHRTWDLLPDISTRVVVATGSSRMRGRRRSRDRSPTGCRTRCTWRSRPEPLRTVRRSGTDGGTRRRGGRHRLKPPPPRPAERPSGRWHPMQCRGEMELERLSTAAIRTS